MSEAVISGGHWVTRDLILSLLVVPGLPWRLSGGPSTAGWPSSLIAKGLAANQATFQLPWRSFLLDVVRHMEPWCWVVKPAHAFLLGVGSCALLSPPSRRVGFGACAPSCFLACLVALAGGPPPVILLGFYLGGVRSVWSARLPV